jgi:AraC family transcriptional regulator, positive regulator of tynA and feaB
VKFLFAKGEIKLSRLHRLSTAVVPPSERLSFWNDTCMRVCGAEVVDTHSTGFQGTLTTFKAEQLQISSFMSTAATCRNAIARRSRTNDESAFTLQLVHAGRCHIRHAGVEARGVAGDMLLADGNRSYELAFSEPVQGLVVSLPRSRFSAIENRLEARTGQLLNVHSGPGAVLTNFIRLAWDQVVNDDSAEWPRSATDVIWDLLESVLHGERGWEASTGRPDRVRRSARTLVDENFRNVGFQSYEMAAALGVSARYLQMVFAEVGTTPSRFLIARRLDGVAARLQRSDRPLRITDVAMECGFSDLSYFSRMFRRRFGVSARAYRQSSGRKSID